MSSTLTLVLTSLGATSLTAALACGGPDAGTTGEPSPQLAASEEPIVGDPEPAPRQIARGLESAAVRDEPTASGRTLIPEDLGWADDTLELERIVIELRGDGRVFVDGAPLEGATTEDPDGLGSSLQERLSRRLESVERCLLRPDLLGRGLPAARVAIRSRPAVRAEALPVVFEVCVRAELWDLRYELFDDEDRVDPEHSFRLLVPFDYSPGRPFSPLELRVEVLRSGSKRDPVTGGTWSGCSSGRARDRAPWLRSPWPWAPRPSRRPWPAADRALGPVREQVLRFGEPSSLLARRGKPRQPLWFPGFRNAARGGEGRRNVALVFGRALSSSGAGADAGPEPAQSPTLESPPDPAQLAAELERRIDASALEAAEKARLIELLQKLAEGQLEAVEQAPMAELLERVGAAELVLGANDREAGSSGTEAVSSVVAIDIGGEPAHVVIELRADGRVLVDGEPLPAIPPGAIEPLQQALTDRLELVLADVERGSWNPDQEGGLQFPDARATIRAQASVPARSVLVAAQACVAALIWNLRYEELDAAGQVDPQRSFDLPLPVDGGLNLDPPGGPGHPDTLPLEVSVGPEDPGGTTPALDLSLEVAVPGERLDPETGAAWDGAGHYVYGADRRLICRLGATELRLAPTSGLSTLAELVRSASPGTCVLLECGPGVVYTDVRTVIEVLMEAGIERIHFVGVWEE